MMNIDRTNARKLLAVLGLVSASLMLGSSTLAAEPIFTTIDFPDSTFTNAFDINADGDIVGVYRDSNNKPHGFLFSDGEFTTIDYLDGRQTRSLGINSRGDIVGDYVDTAGKTRGYLLRDNVFTPIDVPVPEAKSTIAWGIGRRGEITKPAA
jgi:probable HAF family extracellular repeat protein